MNQRPMFIFSCANLVKNIHSFAGCTLRLGHMLKKRLNNKEALPHGEVFILTGPVNFVYIY